jgi:hypothetical protein
VACAFTGVSFCAAQIFWSRLAEIKALERLAMLSTGAVPLLVSVPVLVVLGLVAWGFWRCRDYQDSDVLMSVYDHMLEGLLILAAFTLKVFWVYLLP